MFDLSCHQSKGTRVISIVGGVGTSGGKTAHRISIVAPGGGRVGRPEVPVKKRVLKASSALSGLQMAAVLGTVKRSKGKGSGTKKKRTGVKRRKGSVQKRTNGAKLTISKGRVRLTLASGKRKTVSAVSVVRLLPIATVAKAAQSLGRKGKKKKKKRPGKRKAGGTKRH
jgi:hypothetical protein